MARDIVVDPDQLTGLANDFVGELSAIETKHHDLHSELDGLILGCDPRYRSCFSGVGDAWGSGQALMSKLSSDDIAIRHATDKMVEADDILRKMYSLYDQYGTLTSLAGIVMMQAKYYGLGMTTFIKENGRYAAQHSKLLLDVTGRVEGTRFDRLARIWLSKKELLKRSNWSMADLVHKKFTKFYPSDTVAFTNSVRDFTKGSINWKDTAGIKSVLKNGARFAKGNAIIATVVTGATETVGCGLKIAENYAEFGDQPEVLKRENAKAVGNAVNNTVFIAGGSVAGAVVGGALGSFAGPIGTVVGGAIGSAVGGFIGEKVAKLTSGFAEQVAVKLKDPIHAVVDKGKKAFELAGQGVKAINDTIDQANQVIHKGIEKTKETADSLLKGAGDFLKGAFSFG
ncbi:hypothetical protein P8815_02730 [Bacillus altitudinis]|uniref:DUF6861 domain-containing protein n=1 Tax=Bacillus TaxID=1386 RepID=UPI000260BAC7|nr:MULTISPECIES: glycine zipper domain-containing protein [Bacillus]EIL84553.1 hypothetical protein BAME_22970 [Bacillus sp. M 2-6]MEC0470646.1 hypothetical protein [Bacillus altitudinis]